MGKCFFLIVLPFTIGEILSSISRVRRAPIDLFAMVNALKKYLIVKTTRDLVEGVSKLITVFRDAFRHKEIFKYSHIPN